jgi:hypothetical protein
MFLLRCFGWVPAFAGMTILFKGTSIYRSLFKRENDNIAFVYILANKSNGMLCIGVTANCAVKKDLSFPRRREPIHVLAAIFWMGSRLRGNDNIAFAEMTILLFAGYVSVASGINNIFR